MYVICLNGLDLRRLLIRKLVIYSYGQRYWRTGVSLPHVIEALGGGDLSLDENGVVPLDENDVSGAPGQEGPYVFG